MYVVPHSKPEKPRVERKQCHIYQPAVDSKAATLSEKETDHLMSDYLQFP